MITGERSASPLPPIIKGHLYFIIAQVSGIGNLQKHVFTPKAQWFVAVHLPSNASRRLRVQVYADKGERSGGDRHVNVVLVTHEATEAHIRSALEEIDRQAFIATKTQLIRMESNTA